MGASEMSSEITVNLDWRDPSEMPMEAMLKPFLKATLALSTSLSLLASWHAHLGLALYYDLGFHQDLCPDHSQGSVEGMNNAWAYGASSKALGRPTGRRGLPMPEKRREGELGQMDKQVPDRGHEPTSYQPLCPLFSL